MKKVVVMCVVAAMAGSARADKTVDDLVYELKGSMEVWSFNKTLDAWDMIGGGSKLEKVQCALVLEKLAAVNAPGTTEIEISSENPDLKRGKHTLAEAKLACDHIQRVSYVKAVQYWVDFAIDEAKKIDDGSANIKFFQNCTDVYDKAINAGMKPEEPVVPFEAKDPKTGDRFVVKGTIEETTKKWCLPALQAQKKAQAEAEAPYRKLLKNRKLELALQYGLADWQLAGGTQVTKIEQLAKANVWFSDDHSTDEDKSCKDGSEPRVLHRYTFDTDGNETAHTMKDFCGHPPKKAFK